MLLLSRETIKTKELLLKHAQPGDGDLCQPIESSNLLIAPLSGKSGYPLFSCILVNQVFVLLGAFIRFLN